MCKIFRDNEVGQAVARNFFSQESDIPLQLCKEIPSDNRLKVSAMVLGAKTSRNQQPAATRVGRNFSPHSGHSTKRTQRTLTPIWSGYGIEREWGRPSRYNPAQNTGETVDRHLQNLKPWP